MNRWGCRNCGAELNHNNLLRAPNPFNEKMEIAGCPECFTVDDFIQLCDQPHCRRGGTCGWQQNGIWRITCFEHWKELKGDDNGTTKTGTEKKPKTGPHRR